MMEQVISFPAKGNVDLMNKKKVMHRAIIGLVFNLITFFVFFFIFYIFFFFLST
jgi:hypothetical protein